MSLVLRRPHDMHLFRSCSNVPRLPSFLKLPRNPHVLLPLGEVENPLCLPRKKTVERSKVVRMWCVSNILTWKVASHHSHVRFFRHLTPKSVPTKRCFEQPWHAGSWSRLRPATSQQKGAREKNIKKHHCHFETCFAPQPRAVNFFQRLNFQNLPKVLRQWGVLLCHFNFETCFAPQPRALFKGLTSQKCSDNWCAFNILTSKSASRHSGEQCLISHLTPL